MRTRANTSATRPAVTVTAPARSRWRCAISACDSGRARRAATSATAPTGTLTNRIQRQLKKSVKMPPKSAPADAPAADTALQTPSALARAGPSVNVAVRMVRVAGARMAAPRPCRARALISQASLCAMPPSRLDTVKTAKPTMKILRRPKRSAARPPRSRNPAKVSV